ncbi:hypothetical protein KJ885_03000 [Patescibacteria group bacterium]|nr:hypothetical protein [Patescibacteria group bacterium]
MPRTKPFNKFYFLKNESRRRFREINFQFKTQFALGFGTGVIQKQSSLASESDIKEGEGNPPQTPACQSPDGSRPMAGRPTTAPQCVPITGQIINQFFSMT